MRFVDQFEENYGPNHPVFYQGSYGQALNDAKQELRFLLVYLHQDNNKNCNNFCRYENVFMYYGSVPLAGYGLQLDVLFVTRMSHSILFMSCVGSIF